MTNPGRSDPLSGLDSDGLATRSVEYALCYMIYEKKMTNHLLNGEPLAQGLYDGRHWKPRGRCQPDGEPSAEINLKSRWCDPQCYHIHSRFTVEGSFADSWRIRAVLVPDSFCCWLHAVDVWIRSEPSPVWSLVQRFSIRGVKWILSDIRINGVLGLTDVCKHLRIRIP